MLSPYNVCYRFREKRQRKKDYQPPKQRCRRKGNKKIALGGQATYMHGWHCYRSFANGHSGGFNGHTEACSEQSFCNTDTLASRQTALAAERLRRLFEERQRSRSLSDFLWSLGHSVRFVCEMWIDQQMWWRKPRCASSSALPLFTDIVSFYFYFGLLCATVQSQIYWGLLKTWILETGPRQDILSCLHCSCVHTANTSCTVLSCPCQQCEQAVCPNFFRG